MSTLLEIENAVATLPVQQQQSLLLWLQGVVGQERQTPRPSAASARREWLRRRAARREQSRAGQAGTPLQQIMDDLRGD